MYSLFYDFYRESVGGFREQYPKQLSRHSNALNFFFKLRMSIKKSSLDKNTEDLLIVLCVVFEKKDPYLFGAEIGQMSSVTFQQYA